MILLTGASGFIGKHLLSGLINRSGKENILALTSKPIEDCAYLLHYDYSFAVDYFTSEGFDNIDTIIHAGAFIPKNGGEANNWKLCNSNIKNTEKLLSSFFPALKKMIYLSTVDVYGNADVISENTIVNPVSLYGDSKYYVERMIEQWAGQNKYDAQILRVGHVYGPGEESYSKIIPITIKKCLTDEPIEIWGTGNDIRSFIFIDDIVDAILNTTLKASQGPINLVSSSPVSINVLVDKIKTICSSNSQINFLPTSNLGRNLIFNNSKMKKYLLSSETSLEEGLIKEINYMKQLLA